MSKRETDSAIFCAYLLEPIRNNLQHTVLNSIESFSKIHVSPTDTLSLKIPNLKGKEREIGPFRSADEAIELIQGVMDAILEALSDVERECE